MPASAPAAPGRGSAAAVAAAALALAAPLLLAGRMASLAEALPAPRMNRESWAILIGQPSTPEYYTLVALTLLGGVIVLASFHAQFKAPAPYGRHHDGHPEAASWGPPVHQRTAHIISDLPTGVFTFLGTFLGWGLGSRYGPPNAVAWVLMGLWLLHYVHRGLIFPLTMRYSSKVTPLGIPLAGLFPNALFAYVNAAWIATSAYPPAWAAHPAFILGIILFGVGFVLNRAADWRLRGLRAPGEKAYKIPTGFLFDVITCPNYLGELLQWSGFALAAWSPPGLVWAAFGASTFFPRSLHHRAWYVKLAQQQQQQQQQQGSTPRGGGAAKAGAISDARPDLGLSPAGHDGSGGGASEGPRSPLAGPGAVAAAAASAGPRVAPYALIPFLW